VHRRVRGRGVGRRSARGPGRGACCRCGSGSACVQAAAVVVGAPAR